ncbi:hypothetical protein [Paucibacter sp. KCTC 42545]|uniref:hypothetical protein n=1 Tax=Paucibacter sp. KCTC 42545 TaxID=1768242 RepID=UPI0012E397D2|nr:hypothetical protein [Paucibacter sp. KCTC 42545]
MLISKPAAEQAPVQPPLTPEQIAENARVEVRFQRVVRALESIKKSARNPASVAFEEVLTSDDGSLVCVTLRAENGFSGVNVEHVVSVQGTVMTSNAKYNSNCTKTQLLDLTHARRAL